MNSLNPPRDNMEGHQRQQHQDELLSLPASHHQPNLLGTANTPLRTASSTPVSPGLFGDASASRPSHLFAQASASEGTTPSALNGSPYLHPLQTHKVRETHKALIDSNNINGRKLINQYEVIEEIGRGMHGKVKLAKNLETGENVAIKIIPRFSKKRRLGKVTAMSPQDKTKKEIAILKKIRHPNVVALLEVIDDPELKKIYMVLEHVELGEIVWRKKGLPHICHFERRRIEREMRGEPPSAEEEKYDQYLERRQALKELKRAKMAQNYQGQSDYWSHEYGAADESGSSYGQQSRIPSKEDFADSHSYGNSRASSQAPSRSHSITSISENAPFESTHPLDWEEDLVTPGPLGSKSNSGTALDGTMYGAYQDDAFFYRTRSPSMADSIISHMSSVDFNNHAHDAFADDFSYVPCFTFDQARSAFRDTVLGLEYLHYQGVVHRDIKPANLLWSKDHRVKISDFGVSYFGRPIRDYEMDDTVSESEARDFDNDLELAKTVGTPAFFAPELCYTDLDAEQPKVSEQIDVWSLGVTLYCLVFARIPFLAEDEFQMFRRIATEDVYIPNKRLKPVDPATSPMASSLYKRQNAYPYRDDNDLEYEDVDPSLYDLLKLMLCKNPERRIRLRDIKRHPWVIQGIHNPVGWIDDTEPSRTTGRKIQVNEREMSSAVVPLTFLERARSVVKKAVGKVIHPLVERSESASRNRALSSVASSAGDSMANHGPPTPQARTERRRSLVPDDYFINSKSVDHDHFESSANNTATPSLYDPLATVLAPEGSADEGDPRFGSLRDLQRRHQAHSKQLNHFLNLTAPITPSYSATTPATPQPLGQGAVEEARQPRTMTNVPEETSRSRSVDHALFNSPDKLAQAQVGLDTVVASAHIQAPRHPRPIKSVDLSRSGYAHNFLSSLPATPGATSKTARTSRDLSAGSYDLSLGSEHGVPERAQTVQGLEKRARGSHSPFGLQSAAQPTFFSARAKELWQHRRESDAEQPHQSPFTAATQVPCPPSPSAEENIFRHYDHAPAFGVGEALQTGKSSSVESMDGLGTPLTSPSEMTSPASVSHHSQKTAERDPIFHSDPSLPALLSGASSISADIEGEFLGKPGVVSARPSLLETTDSLTPPALGKEASGGFPIHSVDETDLATHMDSLSMRSGGDNSRTPTRATNYDEEDDGDNEDDDDDNSDDGILLMAKSKKSSPLTSSLSPSPSRFEARRRDTNMSTASDETAKKDPAYAAEFQG